MSTIVMVAEVVMGASSGEKLSGGEPSRQGRTRYFGPMSLVDARSLGG
jgi:hypothetical protein